MGGDNDTICYKDYLTSDFSLFFLLIHFYCHVLGYPVVNDPLYNHDVFGPSKGKGGDIGGKTDEQLVRDLINIHNAENWLGIDGDSELSMFNKSIGSDLEDSLSGTNKGKRRPTWNCNEFLMTILFMVIIGNLLSDDDSESVSREASPCSESPRPVSVGSESPNENICSTANQLIHNNNNIKIIGVGGKSGIKLGMVRDTKVGVSLYLTMFVGH